MECCQRGNNRLFRKNNRLFRKNNQLFFCDRIKTFHKPRIIGKEER